MQTTTRWTSRRHSAEPWAKAGRTARIAEPLKHSWRKLRRSSSHRRSSLIPREIVVETFDDNKSWEALPLVGLEALTERAAKDSSDYSTLIGSDYSVADAIKTARRSK